MSKVKFHSLTPEQVLPALWNAADQEESHVRALRNKLRPRLDQPLDAKSFDDLCFFCRRDSELDGMLNELLVDVLGLRRADFELTSQNGNFVKTKFDPSGYDQKFGPGRARSVIDALLRQNQSA
jgi:hypothetical protein